MKSKQHNVCASLNLEEALAKVPHRSVQPGLSGQFMWNDRVLAVSNMLNGNMFPAELTLKQPSAMSGFLMSAILYFSGRLASPSRDL